MLVVKTILIMFWFSFTAIMVLFCIHAWVNRKTLKLGFSEMPASPLDMFFITLIPCLCIFIGYVLYGVVV